MRAILDALKDPQRRVWLFDSFEGLPKPDPESFQQDKDDPHWRYAFCLAVRLEQVKDNFEKYELLDERTQFVKGWFRDTIPHPRSQISQFCAWMVICTNQHGLCSTTSIQKCRRADLLSLTTTERFRHAGRLSTIFVQSNPYCRRSPQLIGQGSSGVSSRCGSNRQEIRTAGELLRCSASIGAFAAQRKRLVSRNTGLI